MSDIKSIDELRRILEMSEYSNSTDMHLRDAPNKENESIDENAINQIQLQPQPINQHQRSNTDEVSYYSFIWMINFCLWIYVMNLICVCREWASLFQCKWKGLQLAMGSMIILTIRHQWRCDQFHQPTPSFQFRQVKVPISMVLSPTTPVLKSNFSHLVFYVMRFSEREKTITLPIHSR